MNGPPLCGGEGGGMGGGSNLVSGEGTLVIYLSGAFMIFPAQIRAGPRARMSLVAEAELCGDSVQVRAGRLASRRGHCSSCCQLRSGHRRRGGGNTTIVAGHCRQLGQVECAVARAVAGHCGRWSRTRSKAPAAPEGRATGRQGGGAVGGAGSRWAISREGWPMTLYVLGALSMIWENT